LQFRPKERPFADAVQGSERRNGPVGFFATVSVRSSR
jgi:hypothetical protein